MDKKADKKERIGRNIKIKGYDDIFGDDNGVEVEEQKNMGTVFISPSVLFDFKNHPFKVDGKGIGELMESIKEQGILSPIIVRPIGGDGYEVISGHRRRYCALKLGFVSVPVIIRNVDDDVATLTMVDSNIQREDILPSEKAFAYKMKLDAIKRQGKRSDFVDELTSGQVVRKLESSDKIGIENKESGRQIRRYIRLTELPTSLLSAIDNKKMSFNAGVELSYLSEEGKKNVESASNEIQKFPSLSQSKKIRDISSKDNEISKEDVLQILTDDTKQKVVEEQINFQNSEIRKFFPSDYTSEQIENEIIKMLNGVLYADK